MSFGTAFGNRGPVAFKAISSIGSNFAEQP
jgi:hypothetical protein